MSLERHQVLLEQCGLDKTLLSLPLEELAAVDRFLSTQWHIDFRKSDLSLHGQLKAVSEGATREVSSIALSAQSLVTPDGSRDNELYKVMPADEHVFGVVTSKRRHIIIDAVAMTISIARRLNITGPILDIGCHAGFLPDVASQFVDAEFMGIDPVVEAIQFGSRRLLSSGRVELVCASVPWQTERQFPMIVTVDACPSSRSDRGPFLAGVGKLLSRGGIALVISRYLLDPDPTPLRRQLKRADLGYAFADIVGGYGGAPTEFFVEGVLCLIKESPRQLPSKLQSHMQSDWSSFRNYANDPLTPDREKTQSFERAQRVVRSTQIGSALVVN